MSVRKMHDLVRFVVQNARLWPCQDGVDLILKHGYVGTYRRLLTVVNEEQLDDSVYDGIIISKAKGVASTTLLESGAFMATRVVLHY